MTLPLAGVTADGNTGSEGDDAPDVPLDEGLDREFLRSLSAEARVEIPIEMSDASIVGTLCALGTDTYGRAGTEQNTRLERTLRDELAVADERSASLERRVSGLTAAATEAKARLRELLTLHDAIAGASESARGPPNGPATERRAPP